MTAEQRFKNSPPHARSRTAEGLTVAASQGRFALQVCKDCQQVSYPAREICPKCWSMQLEWQDVATGGQLIVETMLRSSTNTYFHERLPWRIGTVALDAGPTVLAHIHGDVGEYERVRMIARTDKSGQGVLMALPHKDSPGIVDDRQFQTLTCNPKGRRVLVTDGTTELGQHLVEALAKAGASKIFVGIPADTGADTSNKHESIPVVESVALNVTDSTSVRKLAADISDQTDILVNMAGNSETGFAHLIQVFAPHMQARGGDANGGACAWVNMSSTDALSASQELRTEFAGSGIKVVDVLFGPPQSGKVGSTQVAEAAVHALVEGIENVSLGSGV